MIIEDKTQKLKIQNCIEGKGIKYILYGTPLALENNRTELDRILAFFKETDQLTRLLYLVDFKGYPGLLHSMIKGKMNKESGKDGLQMFSDFDGVLREHLKSDDQTVLFLVLDQEKRISEKIVVTEAKGIIERLTR